MIGPPARFTLFPYTTLFRSRGGAADPRLHADGGEPRSGAAAARGGHPPGAGGGRGPRAAAARSEEHTSELQSRRELVCRLLLEKKKLVPHKTKLNIVCHSLA